MTVRKVLEIIEQETDALLDEGYVVGVRFENLQRKEGDVVKERSRHNIDREDEREFPEYGTDGYFEMMELDGVSTWDAEEIDDILGRYVDMDGKANHEFMADHGYIMYSHNVSNIDDALDHGEVVLVEPKVAKVLF